MRYTLTKCKLHLSNFSGKRRLFFQWTDVLDYCINKSCPSDFFLLTFFPEIKETIMKTKKSAITNIRKSEEVYIKNLSKNKSIYKDLIEFHKKKILPNLIENKDDYTKLYENIYSHLREDKFELYLNLSEKLEPEQLKLPAARFEEYLMFISSLAEIVSPLQAPLKSFNFHFFSGQINSFTSIKTNNRNNT